MIMKIFAVRDSAIEAFMQPFFAPTNASAVRSLRQAVNDPNHDIGRNTKDYALYLLGEFDDSDGQINPMVPTAVIACSDLIEKSE